LQVLLEKELFSTTILLTKKENFRVCWALTIRDEPRILGDLKEVRKFVSTNKEVTELPINLFNGIKDKLDHHKWHSDALGIQVKIIQLFSKF
jgi:hypothetical protein